MVIGNFRYNSNCFRCGKNKMQTDADTGEQFCASCGYVVSEKIEDEGPEWRSLDKTDGSNPTRTGPPTSLTIHDRGLSTVINAVNRDSTGKPLSSSMKGTIERLRIWDRRSQFNESSNKNLRQALIELNRLKDKLSIPPNVFEKAAYIYRKALDKGLVKGRSISTIIAASVYASCRETSTPRTIKDICEVSNLKRKDIARCYRLLHYELGLIVPVVNPIHCIARISSRITLTEKTKRYAIKILQHAHIKKIYLQAKIQWV